MAGERARFGAKITAAGFAENFLRRKIDNVITDSVNKFVPINLFAPEPERDCVAPVR